MTALRDEPASEAMLDARALAVRSELRAVIAERVAPRAAELDRTGEFAGAGYEAVAQAGLGGLLCPPELGGSGDSALTYAVAVEELAAACPATSLVYMTQMHAAFPLMIAGTEAQQREWVPRLCAGTAYGSIAITEPNAGSDAASLTTTAQAAGGGYVLDGAKTFITTGDRADVIIVFATLDRSAGRGGITAFVLPGDAPGLTRGRPLHKMGMNGSSTAELFLDGVRLPASALLGAEREGWSITVRSVVKTRISAAAQGVGIAGAAYELAARFAHRDGPPGQAVSFALAEMRARALAARCLLYATATAIDRHDAAGDDTDLVAGVSMMKLECTDAGVANADRACELMGAAGDLHESRAEQFLRDAKVTQIYDGTNEIQRLIVGRDVQHRMARR